MISLTKTISGVFVILIIARKEEGPAVYSRGGDDLTKAVLKRRVCWLLYEDKLILQEDFGKLFYKIIKISLLSIGNTLRIR